MPERVAVDVHLHLPDAALASILSLLQELNRKADRIMATSAEHAQQLRDLKAQNEKARAENQAAFKKLQDALDAAGGTTPEVDAAMSELAASIQADDDENPDAPADPGTGG